jgi:hypothetical protein
MAGVRISEHQPMPPAEAGGYDRAVPWNVRIRGAIDILRGRPVMVGVALGLRSGAMFTGWDGTKVQVAECLLDYGDDPVPTFLWNLAAELIERHEGGLD